MIIDLYYNIYIIGWGVAFLFASLFFTVVLHTTTRKYNR